VAAKYIQLVIAAWAMATVQQQVQQQQNEKCERKLRAVRWIE
jgi:hypothetical protein